MPVARKAERQVAPSALPGPRLTAAPTEATLGVDQANQVTRIGAALYEDEILKQDQVAVMEADRKLSAWEQERLYHPQNGALAKRGKDAFGLPDTVSQEFDKTLGDIRGGLSSERQRAAFDRHAETRRRDINGTLTRHVFAEVRKHDDAETENYLQTARQAAVKAAATGDLPRVGIEIERQVASVLDYAKRHGMGTEYVKQKTAQVRSDTHVGAIEALLAAGQDQAASQYAAKVKPEIAGDDVAKVDKWLQEGSLRGESQRIADRILAGKPRLQNADGTVSTEETIGIEADGKHYNIPTIVNGKRVSEDEAVKLWREGKNKEVGVFGSKKEADAAAQKRSNAGGGGVVTRESALAEAAKITDPKLRDAVEDRVNRYWSLRREADRERREQVMIDAANIIDRTGSTRGIAPSVWTSLSPSERTALEQYAKRKEGGGEPKTDWTVYYQLMTLGSSQATRDAFARTNLLEYKHKLGPSEFKQLADLQGSIRKGDGKEGERLDGFLTNKDIVDGALRSINVDPSPKESDKEASTRVATFRRQVDIKVGQEERRLGRKLKNDEVRAITDALVVEGVVPGTGWIWDDKKRVFELKPGETIVVKIADVPATEKAKIEAALRLLGRPVTDQAITDAYSRKLLRMRGE